MTIDLLEKHQIAIEEHFGKSTRVAIAGVSYTQFSIARHYGGCTINGKRFTYFPQDDLLVRDDVLKFVTKLEKELKRSECE
jgi:hypothetical protein